MGNPSTHLTFLLCATYCQSTRFDNANNVKQNWLFATKKGIILFKILGSNKKSRLGMLPKVPPGSYNAMLAK